MKNPIQTAIAGYGLSGQAFHAPFIHTNPNFQLKYVVERNSANARQQYPYIQTLKSLDDVLKDDAVELVVLCTPNTLHLSQTLACLKAGKHVVLEKPIVPSSDEVIEISKAATAKKLKVFPFHNRRWDGDFITIKRILSSGILGEIGYYEAHFDRYSPERKRAAWRDEPQPGGGILYDLGPHLIDQALELFGMPESLKADIEAQREGSQVDDYFKIRLIYPDKEVVVTAGMLVKEHELRYVIHGESGSFIKYGIDPQESELRQGKMPEGKDWGKEDPKFHGLITLDDESEDLDGVIPTMPGNYMGFYDNVFEVIKENKLQKVSLEDAGNVIRIIELAFESSKENEAIKL